MFPRLFKIGLAALALTAVGLPAPAQGDRTIEVIDLQGLLDDRGLEFLVDTIHDAEEAGDVELIILQMDVPAVVGSDDLYRLAEAAIAEASIPLVAWLGPAPAQVSGGGLGLALAADLVGAAPGVDVGYWNDGADFGESPRSIPEAIRVAGLDSKMVSATDPVDGVIAMVQTGTSSLRQFALLLDGREVGGVTLSTVRPFEGQDGTEGVTLLPTVIREAGYFTKLLGIAHRPEAAFFFLVGGLTVAAFEFYAIGPGLAAGVAAISLWLAAAGIVVLPIRPLSLVLTLLAIWLLSVSYQRGGVVVLNAVGLVLLVFTGFWFIDGAPLVRPAPTGVILTVAAAAFFFLLAMPVVARSRFSTMTIGRSGLIGKEGTATTGLSPDGEVEIEGAHWKATSHREAGIKAGDEVTVLGIDGWFLEVEPKVAKKLE